MIFVLSILIININCKNIIKNPSFEEFDSNNKLKDWILNPTSDISHESYSGNNSLHWKESNKRIINTQTIQVEKDFKYEICVNFKLKNITGSGLYSIQRIKISQIYMNIIILHILMELMIGKKLALNQEI